MIDSNKKETQGSETLASEQQVTEIKTIPMFVMGKRYDIPEGLTIMKAMEYAGYRLIRGVGCRGGVCGACGTVYRKMGDYKIYTGLACQTVVEPGMYLTQIPFYPANRAKYSFKELKPIPEEIFKRYPEIFRCLACNACTKVCPMNIPVMDAVAALKRGDIAKTAEFTCDCVQCGLCASRCMGEMPQYHIFQLAKRIYGGKIAPRAEHLKAAVETIASSKYEDDLDKLTSASREELKKLYQAREMEPQDAVEEWKPKDTRYL